MIKERQVSDLSETNFGKYRKNIIKLFDGLNYNACAYTSWIEECRTRSFVMT